MNKDIELIKRCCVCKMNKPYSMFFKDRTNRTGVSSTCKECKIKYKKEYLKRPGKKQKQLGYQKAHYKRNNEFTRLNILIKRIDKQIKEIDKILDNRLLEESRKNIRPMINYYNNPKRCKKCGQYKWLAEYNKSHYNRYGQLLFSNSCKECRNKEKRVMSESYRQTDEYKEWRKEYEKTPNRRASRRLSGAKRRLRMYNLEEKFTGKDIEFIYKQFENKCFNCGSKENLTIDHHYPLSLGYKLTRDNAVLLCMKCNISKHSHPPGGYYNIFQMIELYVFFNKKYLF